MPDHRLVPDERRTRDDMLRRIDLLERRLARAGDRTPIFESHSLGGRIYVSDSGLYYPPRAGRLVGLVSSLDVAGTTETEVLLYRGGITGTLLETITFDANVGYDIRNCNHFCDDTQPLQWSLVTAGTGARSLTIQTEIIPGQ